MATAVAAVTTPLMRDTRGTPPRLTGSECTTHERCCTFATMGRRTRVTLVFTLLGLAVPAVAWADKEIDAGPPNRFTTTDITMDQGEKLTFHNGDTVTHDVTSTQTGSAGKPLFKSAETDGGKSSTVDGAQYLTAGHYDFICSIHPNMKGTIHVTTNGTPAARPGSSQNSTSPSSSND